MQHSIANNHSGVRTVGHLASDRRNHEILFQTRPLVSGALVEASEALVERQMKRIRDEMDAAAVGELGAS